MLPLPRLAQFCPQTLVCCGLLLVFLWQVEQLVFEFWMLGVKSLKLSDLLLVKWGESYRLFKVRLSSLILEHSQALKCAPICFSLGMVPSRARGLLGKDTITAELGLWPDLRARVEVFVLPECRSRNVDIRWLWFKHVLHLLLLVKAKFSLYLSQ